MMNTFLKLLALCTVSSAFQQDVSFNNRAISHYGGFSFRIPMQPSSMESDEVLKSRSRRLGLAEKSYKSSSNEKRIPRTELLAATLNQVEDVDNSVASLLGRLELPRQQLNNFDIEAISKVLSASLLITGNTIGSSMFVLPDAVGGVGFLNGSALFLGLYFYNLISGLILADVAIELHESSECEVPSSFKDFSDAAMKSGTAGNVIGAASLLINSCFLAFGISRAGHEFANILPGGLEPTIVAAAFATILAIASFTQTNRGLEKIANVAVMLLFSSFASLLLPSLANVADPIGTITYEGTNPDGLISTVSAAVPLILSSLTYQNIVPSITKLLDFDRTKSSVAITLGSFLPVAMYISWCYATLGGGVDNLTTSGAGAAALAAFSASALIGSCIACIMSLAEEYQSLTSTIFSDDEQSSVKDKFSIPAVILSVAPPTAVVLATECSDELGLGLLHFCGAIITPFLYGLLPTILYQTISKKDGESASSPSLQSCILASGAVGFIGQEIIHDVSQIIA